MANKKKKDATPDENVQRIFGCNDLRYLPEKVRESLNNFEVYDEFAKTFPLNDLRDHTDYMQTIYMDYLASKGLGQVFTPSCISDVSAEMLDLSDAATLLDIGAGSGSLTLGAWRQNPDIFFVEQEYDMTVIPFLLFNMAARNMNGLVVQGDALQTDLLTDPWNERYYLVQRGEKYSTILSEEDMTREKMIEVLDDMFEKVSNDPSRNNLEQARILTSLADCIERMHCHQENLKQAQMVEKLYASASGK